MKQPILPETLNSDETEMWEFISQNRCHLQYISLQKQIIKRIYTVDVENYLEL